MMMMMMMTMLLLMMMMMMMIIIIMMMMVMTMTIDLSAMPPVNAQPAAHSPSTHFCKGPPHFGGLYGVYVVERERRYLEAGLFSSSGGLVGRVRSRA